MEKKELYMAPAIEDVESRLACDVAQGASLNDPNDNRDEY